MKSQSNLYYNILPLFENFHQDFLNLNPIKLFLEKPIFSWEMPEKIMKILKQNKLEDFEKEFTREEILSFSTLDEVLSALLIILIKNIKSFHIFFLDLKEISKINVPNFKIENYSNYTEVYQFFLGNMHEYFENKDINDFTSSFSCFDRAKRTLMNYILKKQTKKSDLFF